MKNAKHCPWCGPEMNDYLMMIHTDEDLARNHHRPRHHVYCPGCDVTGPEGVDEKTAVEQWNKRYNET